MAPLPRPPPADPDAAWPIPTLVLRVEDLAHPGAALLFDSVKPHEAVRAAVVAVYCWLYTLQTVPRKVEKITVVFRAMPGVAHTFGSELFKEIHFSLDHVARSAPRARDEIMGVLVHEAVHCFQHIGKGAPFPGGLGEGIADWVRLRAGLAPPHWVEGRSDRWDAGYEATGFFLDWLEDRYGYGTVAELNGILQDRPWDELMFKELTGRKIKKLWRLYKEHLGQKVPEDPDDPEDKDDWKNQFDWILFV